MKHGVPRVSEVVPSSEQATEKALKRIVDYKELVDKVESRVPPLPNLSCKNAKATIGS